MKIYLSHGGDGAARIRRGEQPLETDWFVVEPRTDPERLTVELDSLAAARRRVIELDVITGQAKVLADPESRR